MAKYNFFAALWEDLRWVRSWNFHFISSWKHFISQFKASVFSMKTLPKYCMNNIISQIVLKQHSCNSMNEKLFTEMKNNKIIQWWNRNIIKLNASSWLFSSSSKFQRITWEIDFYLCDHCQSAHLHLLILFILYLSTFFILFSKF